LTPRSGPSLQCPIDSTRLRGIRCVRQKLLIPGRRTPTATEAPALDTPTPTETPVDTPVDTPTPTDTPEAEATPTVTPPEV